MLGFNIEKHCHLGDRLIFSSFPQNYFMATGEKIIDLNDEWFYDYNPYVVKGEIPTETINIRARSGIWPDVYKGKTIIHSVAQRTHLQEKLPLDKFVLRHPRIYKYEDSKIIPNKITINTRTTILGNMPKHVVDHIAETYKDFDIYQIGSNEDIPIPGRKEFIMAHSREDWWGIAKHIAESAMYIGVSNGIFHLATCYPRVNTKWIFTGFQNNEKYLQDIIPLGVLNAAGAIDGNLHWLDMSTKFYNCFDKDIGISFSYKKL